MGVGIAGRHFLWPNRTIFYAVDPDFRAPDRLAAAVAHWHAATTIRFVPRRAEADFVRVIRQPGAAQGDVGRRGGEQLLRLGDNPTVGSIVHELGHAVGLWHEHCRSDRDEWVTIDGESIEDGREGDFRIDFIGGEDAKTVDLGAYDYGSIMHYGPFGCARDQDFPTIIPVRPVPVGVEMGQRKALSAGDVEAVEILYAGIPAAVTGP